MHLAARGGFHEIITFLVEHGADLNPRTKSRTETRTAGEAQQFVDPQTPLGLVVCNAGVAFSAPLVDVDVASYDRLMAVNVRGVFLVLQAALRAMLPRGAGSVVTVCSTSSFTAVSRSSFTSTWSYTVASSVRAVSTSRVAMSIRFRSSASDSVRRWRSRSI